MIHSLRDALDLHASTKDLVRVMFESLGAVVRLFEKAMDGFFLLVWKNDTISENVRHVFESFAFGLERGQELTSFDAHVLERVKKFHLPLGTRKIW